jgi:hypothetical protein
MKKFISLMLVVVCAVVFLGCGSDKTLPVTNDKGQTIPVYFQQFGFFSLYEKDSRVQYKLIVGNVIWGALLVETFVAPIIIIGWYLFEPVAVKEIPEVKDNLEKTGEL